MSRALASTISSVRAISASAIASSAAFFVSVSSAASSRAASRAARQMSETVRVAIAMAEGYATATRATARRPSAPSVAGSRLAAMVDFACLFQRFDPAIALAADDPAYVDWQAAVGLIDVKQQLANSVRLTTHGLRHRLVTGLRGGGKTTELRRRAEHGRTRPAGKEYFVKLLDADDTLDLDDADPTDLVVAVVRQLVTDLRGAGVHG